MFYYYRNFNFFDILFLNQTGIRTATLPELSDMVNLDNILLKGKHTFGPEIILRNAKNQCYSNQNISMFNTLKDLAGLKTLKTPYILRGFKLEKDESNEQYGFSVVPNDNFQVFKAPDFSTKNNKRNIKRINPDYSIEWAKEGEKNTGKLYSSPEMVCPIFINEYLDIGSGFGNFEFSNKNSTVITIEDFERDRTQNTEGDLTNIVENLKIQGQEYEEKYKKSKLKYKYLNKKYKKSRDKIRKQNS